MFPNTWKQNDIINHFRKYGPVFIRWIDNTSAFVSLMNRENAPILMKTIGTTKDVKVSPFATYLRVTGADDNEEVILCDTLSIIDFIRSSALFFVFIFYSFLKDDNEEEAESSAAQKRPSGGVESGNQRWNIYLVLLGIVLIILFFIIPDFMIIWELQIHKHVQNFFK